MQTKAVVTVTLTIELPDSWGSDYTIEQLSKEAKSSAMATLRHVLDPRSAGLSEQTIDTYRNRIKIHHQSAKCRVILDEDLP